MRLSTSPNKSQVTIVHMLEDSVNHLLNLGVREEKLSTFLPAFLAGEECSEWISKTNGNLNKNYGRLSFKASDGKQTYIGAHRASLFLAKGGDIDDKNIFAMHLCDNPPCINPNHLSWGTVLDNNRDTIFKGRRFKGVNK